MRGFLRLLALVIVMVIAGAIPAIADTGKATVNFEYYIDGQDTPFTTSKLELDFDPVRDSIEYTIKAPKFRYKDGGGMGSGITDGLVTSLDGPPIDQASVYEYELTKRRVISGLGPIVIHRDNPVRVVAIKYDKIVQDTEVNVGELPTGDDRSFIVKASVWALNSLTDGLNSALTMSGLSYDSLIYGRDVYVVDANGQSKMMKSPVTLHITPDNPFGALVIFFWPIGQNVGVTILYCASLWALLQSLFASSAYVWLRHDGVQARRPRSEQRGWTGRHHG